MKYIGTLIIGFAAVFAGTGTRLSNAEGLSAPVFTTAEKTETAGNSESTGFVPNYDESKVPSYWLPDPLDAFDDRPVRSSTDWIAFRRPQLLEYFESNVYGRVPGWLEIRKIDVVEQGEAFGGKARRRQVELSFENNGQTLSFTILLYLPDAGKPAPVFIGLNPFGNHTIADDPEILVSGSWVPNSTDARIRHHSPAEAARGSRAGFWCVEDIIDAGFGVATIHCGEIDPDRNDFSDGIHPLLYKEGQVKPAMDEWGTIAAWAWGLSRAMDYFARAADVDETRVITMGHSRRGKAALWAAAIDDRFAAAISNNSGCTGAALSHRRFGETVARINTKFPHWFCDAYKQFNDHEDELPVDQHELLALLAPRPVYVASAEDDLWADPRGEYLSAYYASPVFELFGEEGLKSKDTPATEAPVIGSVSYHIRAGKHAVTRYDWQQYLAFAAFHFKEN